MEVRTCLLRRKAHKYTPLKILKARHPLIIGVACQSDDWTWTLLHGSNGDAGGFGSSKRNAEPSRTFQQSPQKSTPSLLAHVFTKGWLRCTIRVHEHRSKGHEAAGVFKSAAKSSGSDHARQPLPS